MLGKYSQVFKCIITVVRDNGCVLLQNIMRVVHPIVVDGTVEFQIPNQDNSTALLVHVIIVINFEKLEYL